MKETLALCYTGVNSMLRIAPPAIVGYRFAMEIAEVRRKNLRELIEEFAGGNQRAFSERCGLNVAHVSQMLTGYRNVGTQTARKIEQKLSLSRGAMDHEGGEIGHFESRFLEAFRKASPTNRMLAFAALQADNVAIDLTAQEIKSPVVAKPIQAKKGTPATVK